MTFDGIVKHLGERGFVTRKRWDKQLAVYFGMDNIFRMARKEPLRYAEPVYDDVNYFVMCMDDILADDWETIGCYWNGAKTDMSLPFEMMEW
jgi:hypothetical protein